ncbi:MAG TPA: hypothetical protein DD381_00010 [Lentisphaeria bacterium]|nr:MAG: hypothetical protein A2X47_12820 [Lentisphaerae bacterium GWF2_38_69]HBM14726.1 hypothetical protein [Lentisphaeria bacterium]
MSALGVSLISNVYNHDCIAIKVALLSSELGNQLIFQTLGVVIAFIFGANKEKLNTKNIAKEFLLNPPTIAIFLGLLSQVCLLSA